MIINFRFKNFKNFKDEVNFSFEKGNKKELPEHIINKNNYNLLPIKAIYGSNAAGKSNLLLAFNLLKKMIITGNIREQKDNYIGLCSNFSTKKDYETPIEFDITFMINEDIYEYKIAIKNYYKEMKSEILLESLYENKEMIFSREKNLVTFSKNNKVIKKHYEIFSKKEIADTYKKQLENNLLSNNTFINWYQIIDGELCQKIKNFFINKVIIIENIDKEKIDLPKELKKETIKNSQFINILVNKLLHELKHDDVKIYFKKEENKPLIPIVKYSFKDENSSIEALAEATESKGILKLIDLIGIIKDSLENGTVLMIDELDASIHHEIIYSIISAYGDQTINKKGAQLVFTTHNPVYMNERLLRRDEIVFVEKNNETSYIHTLDDYNIRNDKRYLRNYLAGEFTILPNFNIGEILESDEN